MKSLFDILLRRSKCAHTHALINTNEGYCPDCGVFLKKYFYIVRCSCCDVKREAKVYFGDILPKEKFCTNCGSKDFYVEKLNVISFIDIPYAIHTKEIVDLEHFDFANHQVWVDENKTVQMKFLGKCV